MNCVTKKNIYMNQLIFLKISRIILVITRGYENML